MVGLVVVCWVSCCDDFLIVLKLLVFHRFFSFSFSGAVGFHWFLRRRPHSFVGWCFGVSRERGPAEPRNMLQICTYNPLTASTRQGCRLEEILFALQTNHVIFLTGTKRPRWEEGQIDMRVSLLQSNWTFAKPGKSVKRPPHKLAYREGKVPQG